METRFKYVILLIATLTLGISSCSKEDDGSSTVDTGKPTKMSLAFSYPRTYANVDGNATADETKVQRVDVYIYNASSAFIKRVTFTSSDFTCADGTNTWKLNSGKEIVTTVGTKKIFVAVNLPAALASQIEDENPGKLPLSITAATDLGNSSNGFAMFSRLVASPALVGIDDTDYDTNNVVQVTVARLLAKVVVLKGDSIPADPINVTGGTIQNLEFAVSNVNTKFFAFRPVSLFLDPNWTSPATVADFTLALNGHYKAVNPKGTLLASANSVYATENTSEGLLEKDHTYATIRGTYLPKRMVTWNDSDLEDGAAIALGTTFYRVSVKDADGYPKNYFFADLENATAYATAKNSSVDTYTNGVTYYNVFLNPEPTVGEHKYDVLRNTIYRVNVTRINGLGDAQDRTSNDENITDPTNMSVEVTIAPWDLSPQNSELSGK